MLRFLTLVGGNILKRVIPDKILIKNEVNLESNISLQMYIPIWEWEKLKQKQKERTCRLISGVKRPKCISLSTEAIAFIFKLVVLLPCDIGISPNIQL